MKLCRVALLTAPALIALSACLAALCTGQAAQAADDLGVAAAELPDAVQKAQDWLGKDCGDARVLYYADGKEPGVFKVRNRLGLAAILDMRLHHLRLGDAERWDPKKTVYGVEFSSDVRREAQHLGADLVGPLPFSAPGRNCLTGPSSWSATSRWPGNGTTQPRRRCQTSSMA